jgi:hypothetical protein
VIFSIGLGVFFNVKKNLKEAIKDFIYQYNLYKKWYFSKPNPTEYPDPYA